MIQRKNQNPKNHPRKKHQKAKKKLKMILIN
jgi:hypothetical protein